MHGSMLKIQDIIEKLNNPYTLQSKLTIYTGYWVVPENYSLTSYNRQTRLSIAAN